MARGRPHGTPDSRPRYRAVSKATSASQLVRDLVAAMKHRRVTAAAMGGAMDLLPASISNYKYGRTTPSVLTVEEMADFLGFDVRLVDRETGKVINHA